MNSATISNNEVAAVYSARDGREYLTIDIPNGWDDVKKLTKTAASSCSRVGTATRSSATLLAQRMWRRFLNFFLYF